MIPIRSRVVAALASGTAVSLVFAALVAASASASAPERTRVLLDSARDWPRSSVVAIGQVRSDASDLESAGNILAVYCDRGDELAVRVSLVAPVGIRDRVNHFAAGHVRTLVLIDEGSGGNTRLPAPLEGPAPFAWDRMLVLDPTDSSPARLVNAADGASAAAAPAAGAPAATLAASSFRFHIEDGGWLAAVLPRAAAEPTRIAVFTLSGDRELDRLVAPLTAAHAPDAAAVYEANVAFVHFGNQGLSYSDVFKGRSGAESASGFDEILRVHEQKNVPGNFHLSGLLQSSAEWNARNGDPLDFNAWLKAGAAAGWAGIVSSPYGQAIMPFLQGSMNDWAIDREVAMETFRYNYVPHVAWVPERCWMTPGQYPDRGVIDYTGAHWQAHGINGVILDDSPHCNGHDNHQIHTVSGNGLRIIPRDGYFTGRMHVGDGAAALAVLTGLAGSGNGTYRLVTYADDWEQAAEMGNWATDYPFALDTYLWMIDKCATESAWLHTWKLDAALANPNFNGDTFTPVNGTYGGIGDVNGYGGNNNAWYADWAGYVPYPNGGNNGACGGGGGNCKNFGTLWNDAHFALQNAPDNTIRETGWYVMMTNLHETGWHDYLGGPISGWQRQYSSHVKNANIYAEAAKWAGGLYANPTGAYPSDIDNDGFNELVMYNDRVMAVFEANGGRCTHLFAKNGGQNYSVIGIDNAYWAETEGDYNDVNHVGGLSDVGPNYQHDLYSMTVDIGSGNTVQATFTHAGVRKVVKLTLGQAYLDVIYRVGTSTQYVKSGWSPDVVDLLYNARMNRVWGGGNRTYMGERNPNTGATAAYVLGSGGATHNREDTSMLMKVDEIYGTQKFEFYLYAGATSAPDTTGHIAELETLKSALVDQLAPEAQNGTYFPATRQLALTFDEPVRWNEITLTGIKLDANNDGVPDVTLDGGCTVLTASNAATITIQVSTAVHNAIQALTDRTHMRLLLTAGAVKDVAGIPHATLTNAGNVFVSYGPATLVTLDGRFDPAEWPACAVAVADSFDSAWNPPAQTTNEIQAVYATWDSTYLYLGIRGVATANSWLLYLDTDPGGPNGQIDLRAISAWERGVQFAAPGFKADWEFGAYQHQGAFDSQSFFKLASPTVAQDSTAAILAAFDPQHANGLNGGSEIAIPWNVLYALGAGHVPANAQLGLVATLCYDPEPSGEAGGDQAPNNTGGVLPPMLNNRVLVPVDQNGDGRPDLIDRAPPVLLSAAATSWDSVITLTFDEPVTAATANQVSHYTVFQTGNPSATIDVRSATLQGDNVHVRLLVTPMSFVSYTVVANGISDASCFANLASQTSATFQGPPVAVDPAGRIERLELASPYPNPAQRGTLLEYAVPGGGERVTLDLYDLNGRLVRRVVDGVASAGRHRLEFDGRDARGAALAPGMFFVRLSRGAEQRVKRLIVLP